MSAFGAGSNTQCNQHNNCKIIAMVAVPICHYHDSIEWCHKGARRFVAFAELIVVAPLAGRRVAPALGKSCPSRNARACLIADVRLGHPGRWGSRSGRVTGDSG
jgi:hypothetical protein